MGGTGTTNSASATPTIEKTESKSSSALSDPNLTDDTFVVEAPSFIVPYVYEKPPREAFQDFKADIKKLMAEIKAKLAEEEKLRIEKGEKIEDAEDKEEDPEDK